MHRIPREEFLPYVPENNGEQVRINHDNCPAGADSRRRLYVKRTTDGRYALAYCHNCSGRGVARVVGSTVCSRFHGDDLAGSVGDLRMGQPTEQGTTKGLQEGTGGAQVPIEEVRIPRDATFRDEEWPREARGWLSKYGVTNDGTVFYSDSRNRVGIVFYDDSGRRSLVTYRRIFPWDTRPKYVTYRAGAGQHKPMTAGSGTLVVTEDWLSARKAVQAGYDAYPLLTTTMKPDDLASLSAQYGKVVVWLDNDNPVVKKNRDAMVQSLSLLTKATSVVDKSDPKDYTVDEIRRVIQDADV